MELEKMGKAELRAACKEHGIKYGGLKTLAGMRAALAAVKERVAVADLAKDADAYFEHFGGDEPAPTKAVVKDKPARSVAEVCNGVKRPGKGACADVWAMCDELLAKGTPPDATTLRELADKFGWNRNNVSIELSRWRKYNGIARPMKTAL